MKKEGELTYYYNFVAGLGYEYVVCRVRGGSISDMPLWKFYDTRILNYREVIEKYNNETIHNNNNE